MHELCKTCNILLKENVYCYYYVNIILFLFPEYQHHYFGKLGIVKPKWKNAPKLWSIVNTLVRNSAPLYIYKIQNLIIIDTKASMSKFNQHFARRRVRLDPCVYSHAGVSLSGYYHGQC